MPVASSSNQMNKTGFDFTQKFEKSELSTLAGGNGGIGKSGSIVRKGVTPKNENE